MSREDTAYWKDELEAYLAMRDDVAVVVADVRVENGCVTFDAPHLDREERAGLINDLGRHGFTVESATDSEAVEIAADGTRLAEDYTDHEVEP